MQELVRVAVAAILVASAIRVVAQEPLPRIPFPDARLKIIRIVQAEPVAGVYANTVTADVIVGLDGSVESVSVIQGQQAQRASATSALKQYKFSPVMIDGKPTRVIVRIGVHVPDTIPNDALANSPGTTKITVGARQDLVLRADCSRAVTGLSATADPIQLCRAAVDATDQSAVSTAEERRAVRGWLADAYMLVKQWPDVITACQSALSIVTKSDADQLRTGELLTRVVIAYANLGDFEAADRNAASAAATVERSMAAHPDERREHVDILRAIYVLSAQVKLLRGDGDAAMTFERKAAALGSK
jgi:hypothetical protein